MAHNELGPDFVRIFYTSGGTPHVQTLEVLLSGVPVPGEEPFVTRRDMPAVEVGTAILQWVDTIKVILKTTDTFTGWEVYRRDPVTGDPIFIYADDLSTAGTSAGTTLANGQLVATFGTIAGGLMKIYLMEPTVAADTRNPLKTTTAGFPGTLATYVLSNAAWMRGRDGALAVRGIYLTTKINDTLRKKALLDQ